MSIELGCDNGTSSQHGAKKSAVAIHCATQRRISLRVNRRDRERNLLLHASRQRTASLEAHHDLLGSVQQVLHALQCESEGVTLNNALSVVVSGLSSTADDIAVETSAMLLVDGGIVPSLLARLQNGSHDVVCASLQALVCLHLSSTRCRISREVHGVLFDIPRRLPSCETSVAEALMRLWSMPWNAECALALEDTSLFLGTLLNRSMAVKLGAILCEGRSRGGHDKLLPLLYEGARSSDPDVRYHSVRAVLSLADTAQYWELVRDTIDPVLAVQLCDDSDHDVAVMALDLLSLFPSATNLLAEHGILQIVQRRAISSHTSLSALACFAAVPELVMADRPFFLNVVIPMLRLDDSDRRCAVLQVLIALCYAGDSAFVRECCLEETDVIQAVNEKEANMLETVEALIARDHDEETLVPAPQNYNLEYEC